MTGRQGRANEYELTKKGQQGPKEEEMEKMHQQGRDNEDGPTRSTNMDGLTRTQQQRQADKDGSTRIG